MSVTHAPRAIGDLRAQIDALDSELLHLMERRLELGRAIAAAKSPEASALMLRPGREEQVIGRLAARSGSIPAVSIAAIWRELMSLNLQAQQRTTAIVHAPRHPGAVVARLSARFGASVPIRHAETVAQALSKARDDHAIAVIEFDQEDDWWRVLADDPDLVIIDELRAPGGRGSALAVGRVAREHLAHDRSWQVVEDAELLARLCRGETICPLAAAGTLRLCVVERMPAAIRAAA